MKKNTKLGPFAHFESGKVDMLFDNVGLENINRLPNAWTYQPQIRLITSKGQSFDPMTLCKHQVGGLIRSLEFGHVVISEINLIRLEEVTEELALRSGVEEISKGMWKHYAPEMFFPKAMLKKISGSLGYSTAKGSFFSRWCKEQNDMMDIYSNPWIWQYTCVAEKKPKTAVVMIDGKTGFGFPYKTLEEMAYFIFDKFVQKGELPAATVTADEFGEVVWDHTLAHYCFAHGKITETELVRIMFRNEDAETVLGEREGA